MAPNQNRYDRIIEEIFVRRHRPGVRSVPFSREEIIETSTRLGMSLPKNLGDLIYSYRFRTELPEAIRATAPPGEDWVIRLVGRGQYSFQLSSTSIISPNPLLTETKIPNATPGMIDLYALTDEQSALAKIRYNRLIDVFTGVTCYSLQSHLRTAVPDIGQVETDEIYVGLDKKGVQYVLPVQAKGRRDKISIVQIEQDVAMCADKFPNLVCVPVGAQSLADNAIALFAFETTDHGIALFDEKHYRLVAPSEVSPDDLAAYRQRVGG